MNQTFFIPRDYCLFLCKYYKTIVENRTLRSWESYDEGEWTFYVSSVEIVPNIISWCYFYAKNTKYFSFSL